MRPLYISAFLLLLCCASRGQEPCSFDRILRGTFTGPEREAYEARLAALSVQASKGQAKGGGTVLVPVVFHILWNDPAENVADSVVMEQLAVINDDLLRTNADAANTPAPWQAIAAGADIELCMATVAPDGSPSNGIHRVQVARTAYYSPLSYAVPDTVKHDALGGVDAWDPNVYLNVWVCNLEDASAYATPPLVGDISDDGIVCYYRTFGITGSIYPYDGGRTMTHEFGHWLCLKHIWGDDGNACTGTDYMADTPDQAGFYTNCPSFPVTDGCTPNAPGVMFMNYMDYTNDGCRNMFTEDQAAYMNLCMVQLRPAMFSATGCAGASGIADLSQSDLVVAPSLVSDMATVRCPWAAQAELLDGLGRVVAVKTLSQGRCEFDAAGLRNGLYVIRVRNGERVATARMVVQH